MNNLYIVKDTVTSMQVDTNDSQGFASPETSDAERANGNYSDAGFAPLSPDTPSWGPPSGTNDTDPGYAPISPETPSWGPPTDTNGTDPGFAPISPETPSFGPPSSGSATDSGSPGFAPISPETPSFGPPSGSGSSNNTCTNCIPGWITPPIVVVPGQGSQSGSGMSNVRFLYAATGQSPVNIRLGNRRIINRMQFGNSTPYYLENAGYQTILITNSNTGRILYRSIFFFSGRTAYTFAIVNNGSGISLMQLIDTPCTNRNTACVRAVNLSPNSGAIDVFLSGIGRIFQNVDTFGVTSYRAISQGAYRASVSEALPCTNNSQIIMAGSYVECNNTRIAVMDSANVNFMSGVSYTIYLIGLAYQLPAAQLLTLESDLVY